jgi:hypothetical protein
MNLSVAFLAAAVAFGAVIAQAEHPARETPFFCNLKALTATERQEHLQLTKRLAQALLKATEIADGYAFELDGRQLTLKDLATWTDFERRCCPFFDFVVELRRENGPMTLRLTGREGVKEFIRAEFQQIMPQ